MKKGYHKKKIKKGILGEISKIQEELDELKDASDQNIRILMLCEMADLFGALEVFLQKYFPNLTMFDLGKMADATKRAFETGER